MKWKDIREEYETSNITMKELADQHGVKYATLRSRKNREKWQRNATIKDATQRNTVATKKAVRRLNANKDLTEAQKQFCLLYLRYFNATKAYQEAFKSSYSTACSHGYRLLQNVEVKKELDRLKEAQRTDLYIDSLDIKKEYIKQSFADITDFIEFGYTVEPYLDDAGQPLLDENGEPMTYKRSHVNFKNMEEVDGTLIQEVRMGKDGPVLKLHDKQKAMQELSKLLEGTSDTGTSITIVDRWATDES